MFNKRQFLLSFTALLITACVTTPPSEPQKIVVFSSGGFFAAYDELAPQFEKETGIVLETHKGSSSGGAPDSIPERLKRGECADVVILSENGFKNISKLGFVLPETKTDLVRSKIGMSIKDGAIIPDISTAEKFTTVLREAESIGYSASASGRYLSTKLWPEMGIWEEINPKSTRVLSERVATVVARGDLEIGFQQISEILPIPGAAYAGPIPEELQKVTVFTTGITTEGNQDLALKLISYLSDIDKAETIKAVGLEPVALSKVN